MYFDDLATIKVSVTDYTGVRFAFKYEIYNQNNKLCTTGTSRHCFMTRDGRPVSLKRTQHGFDQLFINALKDIVLSISFLIHIYNAITQLLLLNI